MENIPEDLSPELRAEWDRLWSFYEKQPYFNAEFGRACLTLYITSVALAEQFPPGREHFMKRATQALESIGLTPESRKTAIRAAKRRARK